jgi:predicted TIM-barrel fold metal-dependent hydrolase
MLELWMFDRVVTPAPFTDAICFARDLPEVNLILDTATATDRACLCVVSISLTAL